MQITEIPVLYLNYHSKLIVVITNVNNVFQTNSLYCSWLPICMTSKKHKTTFTQLTFIYLLSSLRVRHKMQLLSCKFSFFFKYKLEIKFNGIEFSAFKTILINLNFFLFQFFSFITNLRYLTISFRGNLKNTNIHALYVCTKLKMKYHLIVEITVLQKSKKNQTLQSQQEFKTVFNVFISFLPALFISMKPSK